jgi:hypothetical protein
LQGLVLRATRGDGGPAIQAPIYPFFVAVDKIANVFIADPTAATIRKVSLEGTIFTVAGTGTVGYPGDVGSAKTPD